MYDAIIVGARCAGSPTAMLLARRGYRVLLLDRATFPSDTMSTHFVHTWGVERLKRWGLLDRIAATGCPPITRQVMSYGGMMAEMPTRPYENVAVAYCPRRTVLDKILLDAAVQAGAEAREGFVVKDLLWDGGAVAGVAGRDAAGSEVQERARMVIGADGMRSLVARSVQAPTYEAVPGTTCGYFAYWSGVPLDGIEIHYLDHRAILLFPTNDGLTCAAVQFPRSDFTRVRQDIEGSLFTEFDRVPGLGDRMRAGRRETRYQGDSDMPGFFRVPYGPGWGLVGDAGYYKDPITGTGMSDAFRDAELLAEALAEGFSGIRPMEEALAGYQRRRDEQAMPWYRLTTRVATLPTAGEIAQAFMEAFTPPTA
jgi:flavin-dependent dehydrogenase